MGATATKSKKKKWGIVLEVPVRQRQYHPVTPDLFEVRVFFAGFLRRRYILFSTSVCVIPASEHVKIGKGDRAKCDDHEQVGMVHGQAVKLACLLERVVSFVKNDK